MTGKRWTGAAIGILLAGTGCVSCASSCQERALAAGPACDLPMAGRQKVYAVLVNGLIPVGACALEGLRDRISEHGFAKIYCGHLCHLAWFRSEMRKVHCDEPDARFVVVGYDLGASAAARLVCDAVAEGIPVEAVVLLDPSGKPAAAGCPARTVVVCSGGGRAAVPNATAVSVPDAGHFTLPTHPRTVEVVVGLMRQVGATIPPPAPPEFPAEWGYEHAPAPRSVRHPGALTDPDWDFLYEPAGFPTRGREVPPAGP